MFLKEIWFFKHCKDLLAECESKLGGFSGLGSSTLICPEYSSDCTEFASLAEPFTPNRELGVVGNGVVEEEGVATNGALVLSTRVAFLSWWSQACATPTLLQTTKGGFIGSFGALEIWFNFKTLFERDREELELLAEL